MALPPALAYKIDIPRRRGGGAWIQDEEGTTILLNHHPEPIRLR